MAKIYIILQNYTKLQIYLKKAFKNIEQVFKEIDENVIIQLKIHIQAL